MSSPAAREHWRNKRTAMIEYFCASNGFKLDALNEGYQLRIEDSFDFYPTNVGGTSYLLVSVVIGTLKLT